MVLAALRRLNVSIALLAVIVSAEMAEGQLLRGRRLPLAEPEAVAGSPFGVGRVSIQLPEGRPGFFGEREFTLIERSGRVFYATFEFQPVRAILREVLNRPQAVTAHFLFVGDQPLDLELGSSQAVRLRVVPRREGAGHEQLMAAWWDQYTRSAQRAARTDEYPQLVDSYLVSMLSGRLGLAPPDIDRRLIPQPQVDQSLGVLLGTESMRLSVQERIMRSASREEVASEPLPPPIAFAELIAADAADAKVEELALHVPEECFYLRFGSFTNYLWFSRLMSEFGGDLRNLTALRGLDYQLNARQERQLVLKESGLAELLGPQVIADVALVGQDMFLREGAAIGMLFQARNNFGLSADIRSQRAAALQANQDAKETTIEVAGHKVSFVSTADNRIRSFYAVDGDFHFVTTSRTLVRRFYEAGGGERSLGKSAEFRLARAEVPLERDDTMFAYLSAAFFQNLLSPHYQVEMGRRLRSAAEIDLFKMARLAAKNEGQPNSSIDELVRGGFLPSGFGQRADGSELVAGDNGEFIDSIRGGAGSFTPVPDIAFESVTRGEASDYERLAGSITSRWQRIDPIVVAAKRFAGDGPRREQVAIDARVTPLAAKNYETLMNFVGPPSLERMAPLAGNAASFEAVTRNRGPAPIHLYAGVRDTGAGIRLSDDVLGSLGALLNLKFYFGGWPSAGMFSFFGLRDDLPVNRDGFGRPNILLWQRTNGPFITGSNDPNVLADVTPQFRIVEPERPAQLWLSAGDLNRSELRELINGYGYFRARQITGGNLHFMHRLTSQLGVAPEDASAVAENLSGGKLVSALGGTYEFDPSRGGWQATAWDTAASRLITQVPRGFTTPPLDWLRGLDLDAALTPEEISAHAVVVIERRAPTAGAAASAAAPAAAEPILPAFPFKGLDWFGGKKDDAKKSDGLDATKSPDAQPKRPTEGKVEELPEPKKPLQTLAEPMRHVRRTTERRQR